jgi:4-amino-4-deoxy-L-arabinose transferase-like glycosyltransferase
MDVDLIMAVDVLPVTSLEPPISDLHRQRVRAFAVAGLFVFGFAVWLGLQAPLGILCGTDELLGAERTREMLMTEPWVVHYNFHRSFEKPPLQYWLTGLTLPRFQNRALAVRVWPLLYAVLTLVAVAWLVRLLKPEQPWLVPLTIAILISAPFFNSESARGLLDIGLTFFTVLAFVFAELARKKPVWWIAVAIASWLGSLQKFPIPFLIWTLIIAARLTNRDDRRELRRGRGWLIGSLILAVALMSIWPLLQFFKYQMPVGSVYQEEVSVWLGPTGLGQRPYFEIPISMSLAGGLCGFLSLVAPFVILFSKKERAAPAIRELAIVSLLFIAILILSNFRHGRYSIPVLPPLCFLLALFFYRFLNQPRPVRTRAMAALIFLLIAGFVHGQIRISVVKFDVADEKVIAEKLGQLQQPGTKTVLIKAIEPGKDLMWDSFYLFHGNFRFPVKKLTTDEIRANPPKPPLIGASVARDFPVVKELYPNVQVQLERAQFICWQVPAE